MIPTGASSSSGENDDERLLYSATASEMSIAQEETAAAAHLDSGRVWIIMFGFVMTLAAAANLLLVSLTGVRPKQNYRRIALASAFVSGAEFALLGFEFSLGIEHTFPYGDFACKFYQLFVRLTPILQSLLVLFFVVHSHFGEERIRAVKIGLWAAAVLLTAVLAAPILFFAESKAGGFCEISTPGDSNRVNAAFYFLYSAVLEYWLPLLISLPFLIRLIRSSISNSSSEGISHKYPESGVCTAVALSFYGFFLPHAVVVTVRLVLDMKGENLPAYEAWMMKVVQSLLFLVAYFWHLARPALIIILDPDLKSKLAQRLNCFPVNNVEDEEEERFAAAGNQPERPIVKSRIGEEMPLFAIDA